MPLRQTTTVRPAKEFPYMRKYKAVAKGLTNKDRGSWKKPGRVSPEYVTWWVCQDVRPTVFFECVLKFDENNER